ncbi:MAG: acetyl-CoA carboxylase biotin carboxyl carrier protein [Alphaproteobacteria bacterium]|nr:acetyl-CoA carboxylase biotin carboxyl carrier protein [Alphaproteobacteria bacterium]
MDIKKIQELIKMVNKTEIAELSIESSEGKIFIKQKENKVVTGNFVPNSLQSIQQPQAMSAVQAPQESSTSSKKENSKSEDDLLIIKSPMIGTYYCKPGPNKPNFVSVGSQVNKGQTICIIEAMKLFNDIECEYNGIIEEILVEDAQPVEFDQPLFKIRKS